MKYIFCSFMFNDVEENIKNSRSPNSVSGHKFQENVLKGLRDNGCNVTVINTPRIRRYPDYKQIVFKEYRYYSNESLIDDIPFLNIFGLNYITQIKAIYDRLSRIIDRDPQEKYAILVFNTYPAQTVAMQMVKKKYPKVILCNLIGDIYGQFGLSSEKSLHGKLIDKIHSKMDSMAKEFDAFAFATEDMAEALGVQHKPHTVIEGMYNVSDESKPLMDNSKGKNIFYAGALLADYGIEHLLNAFSLIDKDDYNLYIAGGGDAEETVKNYAMKDSRIHFLGFIPPSEVAKYQQSATALVNPRINNHEFVKYSFASKNLECLASGVPYVAHDLPCNPPEYAMYIQYPYDETDRALAEKLIEICEMDYKERISMGEKGREFIRVAKSPGRQMKKLIDLIEHEF